MSTPPNVWLLLPSADIEAARSHLPAWRKQGYKVVVDCDTGDLALQYVREGLADHAIGGPYEGYPCAIRRLCRHVEVVRRMEPDDVFVAAGDDMWPDPNFTAGEIQFQFTQRFPHGFGVMQPSGDGHGAEVQCGSPWFGTAFARRMNGGQGIFWPQYNHYFADRELFLTARKLGVLYMRGDLTHKHDHWSWTTKVRPDHMLPHRRKWSKDRDLFFRRQKEDFPGHTPLE